MSQKKGMFITVEGVDAAGKSSQIEIIKDEIAKTTGLEIVTTREPGGTDLANEIRTLVKTRDMDPLTELLLMNAARKDHIEKVIKPAVQAGKVVICDRFTDSTYAYQGVQGKCTKEQITLLKNLVQEDLDPDATFYFDVSLETSKSRRNTRGEADDRLEKSLDENFIALRNIYRDIAEKNPSRVTTINGEPAIEKVTEAVIEAVTQTLKNFGFSKKEQLAISKPRNKLR